MKKLALIAVLWSMTGCASQQHMDTAGGPEGKASLEAYTRELMAHVGKGDFAFLKQSMCEEAIVFDIDEHGMPFAVRGRAEVEPFLDHMQAMMSQPGVSSSIAMGRVDCDRHAMFCALEFDETVVMGGQTIGPMKFRATLVAKHHGDKWIWTHWHASLREAPQAVATAAAAAPPAPEVPMPTGAAAPGAPSEPPPAPAAPPAKAAKKKAG